ncbi:hypothetical protein I553_6449 [Mycobacterium xenopi 4042]|uniref:Uncharacterized protein n=1 Tax=Mycobacterium xenopi 4042 TaxID=1299334 RepID=X8BFD4_MYCXE|nr:hypothetical protein I553_6449 [Mycobacterium xenopi 4042]
MRATFDPITAKPVTPICAVPTVAAVDRDELICFASQARAFVKPFTEHCGTARFGHPRVFQSRHSRR